MSEQPPPKPGNAPVAPTVLSSLETASRHRSDYANIWPWLEKRIQAKVEASRELYGGELVTNSSVDALACTWDAAVATVMYLTQAQLEGEKGLCAVAQDARRLLLNISRFLWERDHPRVVCVSTPGPTRSLFNAMVRQKPVNDQTVYGLPKHDPSKFCGDWCDCEACAQYARSRNFVSEPE